MKFGVAWTSHPSFHAILPNVDARWSWPRASTRVRLLSTLSMRELLPRPPPTPPCSPNFIDKRFVQFQSHPRVCSHPREETLSCGPGRASRIRAHRTTCVFTFASVHPCRCTLLRRRRIRSDATGVDRTHLVAICATSFRCLEHQTRQGGSQQQSTNRGETCSDGWSPRRRHTLAMERVLARRVDLWMHVRKRDVQPGGAAKAGDATVGEAAGKTCS